VLTAKGGMTMVDREKILRGLEHCCDPDKCDAGCPYYKDYDDVYDCMSKIAGDALELLKEDVNEKSVPVKLFSKVLGKYKKSKYLLIWNSSVHIREDLKALNEEIRKYKKLAGM
jgi:hypothetical protein